ncbi:MAG: hypothetical protein WDO74_36360 [Pseudomonadota bacterium]
MSSKPSQDDLPPAAAVKAPSPHERRLLSAASLGIDERTIIRAYLEPARVRESTRIRLAAAAQQIGLAPPPSPINEQRPEKSELP